MKTVKISDVAKLNQSSINSKNIPELIYYYDTSSITENVFKEPQILKNNESIPSRCKRIVKDKTIVYSTVRPRLHHYGIFNNPKPNTIVSTGYVTIDADEQVIDSYYLFYKLIQKGLTEYLSTIADTSVSSYPSINPEDIGNIKIEIEEDINKQRKIVELIKLSDVEINNCLDLNKYIEKLEKELFDYWFFQYEFPNEEGKPYKISGGQLDFNNLLNNDIPKNWDVVELKEHIRLENGVSYNTPDIEKNVGIPMINLANIDVDRNYVYNELKYLDKKVDSSKIAKPGDMLIACTDLTRNAYIVGSPIFVPNTHDKFTYSADLSKLVLTSNIFTEGFLYRLFRSDNFHNYIKAFASGTNVLHLDVNGLYWYKCVVPPLELQKKFDEMVQVLKSKTNENLNRVILFNNIKENFSDMLLNEKIKI